MYYIAIIMVIVIMPHRPYVGAAYRMSSMVCRSVRLVSPAKTDEVIEMPFGLRTWVGLGNHVLYGVQIPIGRGTWEKELPIVKYRDFLP